MCGINGALYYDNDRPVAAQDLDRMRAAQRHRGPDAQGIWINGRVGFGFNRLAIIDLAGGHQPMANDDGSVCLVFNGEIYNFLELRAELESHGWRFRTRSDTEVILRGWEQWGEECVHRLRGMFAFVLWDGRRQILFGARDRLGIKPLYYWAGSRGFVFASELKSLLEWREVPRELDETALEEYLRRRYVIAPRTILKHVWKLPPGHCFTVAGENLLVRRYWQLPEPSGRQVSEQEAVEEWTALMDETVRLHLIADVPLGAFLSGGLDSSTVVAWMARLGVRELKTFSIGYDAPESELDYARQAAQHIGTEHHEIYLNPSEFRDLLPKTAWHMDEPVADEASLALFVLVQFTRREVKVVLSGEGADEIFGGYNYQQQIAYERWRRYPGVALAACLAQKLPWPRLQRKMAPLAQPLEARYQGVSKVFTSTETQSILRDPPQPISASVAESYRRCPKAGALERMLFLDMATWLPDDLLVKADRMTMAASLELRVPFLDHKMVEFVWNLPADLKIRRGVGKYLLKRPASRLLPERLVYRRKAGFPVPLESWVRNDLRDFVRDSLLAGGGVEPVLERRAIEDLLAAHDVSERTQQIYALLILDQWMRQFLHVPAQVA